MRVYLVALILLITFTLAVDYSLWLLWLKHFKKNSKKQQTAIRLCYWLIPLFFITFLVYLPFHIQSESIRPESYYRITILNGIYLLFYIPKIFLVLYFSILQLIPHKKSLNPQIKTRGKRITRAQFLGKMSTLVAAIPFAAIMYSITKGKFNFTVKRDKVAITNLPQGLKGLRIVQLSDIHLGNFNSRFHILKEVIENINALNPDLIFITGDLVNNFASETHGWEKVFSKLKAKHGKFAILGNHDYGDYSDWKSDKLKEINFKKIKQAYRDFGFELMLNTNKTLLINNSPISLIGVENWGHPPFPRYGNLSKAMEGELAETKILLTHDPDHWEAEVLKYTDIDLSLSGHTHGMQVGLTFKNKQWSPAKWKYKYWGGLYKVQKQYLYVNRGLGFIGIPLRIGMPPEITLLTLVNS